MFPRNSKVRTQQLGNKLSFLRTYATSRQCCARHGQSARKAKKSKARTKPAIAKSTVARDGSKTAKILDLLKRPGGATSKELIKATGWLPHSVRGFLSGTVGKKMGLTVTSTKNDEDGERTYSVEV